MCGRARSSVSATRRCLDRTAAFRVDAGAGMGIGHLRRCLTLAAELRVHGFAICFVCGDRLGQNLEQLLAPYDAFWLADVTEVIPAKPTLDNEMRDAEATLRVVGSSPAAQAWAVLDSYHLGFHWERRVREAGYRILVIDDYRDRRHHADLFVSDSSLPLDPAFNDVGDGARALVGRKYALLDPSFAFSGAVAPTAGPKRLLITYGGADATGETAKAIEALRTLRIDSNVRNWLGGADVVIGPANPQADAIKHAVEGIPGVVLHSAPASLAPLMCQADLILTAGGNTLVEALALRKPCIVTVTAENQALTVGELSTEGLTVSLGRHESVGPQDIASAINVAFEGYDVLAAQVASSDVYDHLGARRVAEAMLAFTDRPL